MTKASDGHLHDDADDEGSRDGERSPAATAAAPTAASPAATSSTPSGKRRVHRTWKDFYEEVSSASREITRKSKLSCFLTLQHFRKRREMKK